jgi:hypothetical protein
MATIEKHLGDLVVVEHAWSGMSCNICARGMLGNNNEVRGCDLGCKARDQGYCCLFVPHEDRVQRKRDIVGMMEMHVQRWIREKMFGGL